MINTGITVAAEEGPVTVTKLSRFELISEEDWRSLVETGSIDPDTIYFLPVKEEGETDGEGE